MTRYVKERDMKELARANSPSSFHLGSHAASHPIPSTYAPWGCRDSAQLFVYTYQCSLRLELAAMVHRLGTAEVDFIFALLRPSC